MSAPRDRRVGKYELVRRVGVGGMAEVFEAVARGAEGFNRRVALKLLLPELNDDPEIVDMFIDEATIAARLEHPNIVAVFDFGSEDGAYFLAMEFVDGPTVAQLLRQLRRLGEPFPLEAAAQCVRDVCRALHYIHTIEQQIVHRDVTPHNVFVSRLGQVKLGDFGIAKTAVRRSRTSHGEIKGKLAYLAPEQATGEPISCRTDVYAAGLLLFELVAGRRLIAADSDVELIRTAMAPPVIPPSEVRAEAAPLDAVVLRALEQVPTMRFPTAAAMAEDLDRYLAPVGNLGADQLKKLAAGEAHAPPPTHPATPQPRPRVSGASVARPSTRRTRRLEPGAPIDDNDRAEDSPPVVSITAAAGPHPRPPGRSRLLVLVAAALIAATAGLALALALRSSDPALDRADTSAVAVQSAAVDATGARSPPVRPGEHVADARGAAAAHATAVDAVGAGRAKRRPPRRRPRAKRPAGRRTDGRTAKRPDAGKAAGQSPAAAEPPRPEPPRPEPPATAALADRLEALRRRAGQRGLFAGDDPKLDQLVARARAAPSARQAAEATTALEEAERRVAAFKIDRPFADRKLARLNRAIQRSALPAARRAQIERQGQQIVRLIIGGQLVSASREMSAAMDRIRMARGR